MMLCTISAKAEVPSDPRDVLTARLISKRQGKGKGKAPRGLNSPAAPALASAWSGLRVISSSRQSTTRGLTGFFGAGLVWTGLAGAPGKMSEILYPLASYHFFRGEWVSRFRLQLNYHWKLSTSTTTTDINHTYPAGHWGLKANKIIQEFC